jgi:peptidoglycan/LPS O-acetylase OafA/YrhL
MIYLDTLRAFAVCGVMLHHFVPSMNLHSGYLGVQLFFVLSGYLITGILLRCRDQVEQTGQPASLTLRRFYLRRFLRLFPAYYLVIGVAWITHLSDVRDHLWWYVTYLSNVLFSLQGYYPEATGHLWSLAVEEQFYLIWPVLVLYCPRPLLGKAILSIVAIGPLFRWIGLYGGLNPVALYTLPFASADSLGMGALLAYTHTRPALRAVLLTLGFWATCVVVLALLAGMFNLQDHWVFVLRNTVCALSFAWLVWRASQGFGGAVGRWLACPALIYLGKISYGIYLYHLFTPSFAIWELQALVQYPLIVALLQPMLWSGLTIAVSSLSWFLYEKPINTLKSWFPYTNPSRAAQSQKQVVS